MGGDAREKVPEGSLNRVGAMATGQVVEAHVLPLEEDATNRVGQDVDPQADKRMATGQLPLQGTPRDSVATVASGGAQAL